MTTIDIEPPSACYYLPVNLVIKEVERVGPRFQAYAGQNDTPNRTKSDTMKKWNSDEFIVDIEYLRSLDPKEWKDQDHYAVLGLGNLRYNAFDDDIRRAYRKMVLLHHPDKRKAKGEEVNTDTDYFTCITKAYDVLGTQKSRRAYDSVDPEFDDSLPTQTEIENNFYEVFQKYFDLNARWSEKKNVPSFGDENANREDVDNFYSFWYDFESWREFSYLDEEDKEKGQDRDERRWIEKQNKTARLVRKKKEMSRIRALVDLAYNNDKRIVKFKNEEKQRKLALKRAKLNAAQAQKEEMERAMREAQLAKEKADKAEQKRIEKIRVEKEQYKKAVKKERKLFRDRARDCKYFTVEEKDLVSNMEGVEKICEMLSLLELQELNKKMEDSKDHKLVFTDTLKDIEKKINREREEMQQNKNEIKNEVKVVSKNDLWSNDSIQLLIKAVNLFPAGTAQRWDVIATFMNQHAKCESSFSARDVLGKAKSLQQSDFSKSALKTDVNVAAFQTFQKSKKDNQVVPDNVLANNCNDTNVAEQSKGAPDADIVTKTAASNKNWTKEEQALLEQAIKTFPVSTPDRWDRIAACIPNRSKKDCLRRVKELVDMVNSKKDAKQATQ